MKTKFKCTLDVGTVAMSAASGLYGIVTLHVSEKLLLFYNKNTLNIFPAVISTAGGEYSGGISPLENRERWGGFFS